MISVGFTKTYVLRKRFYMHVDCVYGLASHMLGEISNDLPCGVADTHLVVVIPTLSVNMEKGCRSKMSIYLWPVGKWEGCPGCDYLSSAEKVTKT